MKYAIIAAGEGSRLAKEGVSVPKPLVSVQGEPLVDRLIRIFSDHQASEIAVICNELMPDVVRHLKRRRDEGKIVVPLRVVVKSTPSSMHSLYELSPFLDDEVFCAATVDTVFREEDFAGYVKALQRMCIDSDADGLMAVTAHIDDEKPLYVSVGADEWIDGFHDAHVQGADLVSAGIYGLTRRSLPVLRQCVQRGESRMRNFQRALLDEGLRLRAYPFGKVLDIDHADDITKAEAFLQEGV